MLSEARLLHLYSTSPEESPRAPGVIRVCLTGTLEACGARTLQEDHYRAVHYGANICWTSCGRELQSAASLASQYPPLYLLAQHLVSSDIQWQGLAEVTVLGPVRQAPGAASAYFPQPVSPTALQREPTGGRQQRADLNRGRGPLGPSRPSGALTVNQAGGSEVAPVCLMYCFSRTFARLSRVSATLAACTHASADTLGSQVCRITVHAPQSP